MNGITINKNLKYINYIKFKFINQNHYRSYNKLNNKLILTKTPFSTCSKYLLLTFESKSVDNSSFLGNGCNIIKSSLLFLIHFSFTIIFFISIFLSPNLSFCNLVTYNTSILSIIDSILSTI